MDAISTAAASAGIPLIEDAAQAHGAAWRGKRAGSFGVAACFSFYPGKNLGAFGDGGAVVTSDAAMAGRIRSLANHGRATGRHYEHDLVGINSRLDSLQAVTLTAKLERLDAWNEARGHIVNEYRKALADTPIRLLRNVPGATHAYHLCVARVADRDRFQAELAERGVQTAVHYPIPCHQQPPYRRYADRPLPVSEQAASQIVSLPLYPHLTDDQVAAACAALRAVARLEASAHV